MAGLLDSITGFFEGPKDPTAIDPRYGISQQQLYDAKMASLGSAGMTLLAAGQRMQPGERAQLLGQLGNIPGQYQQSISDAMKQRLVAAQLRSGEQDLAANEAFSKRLAGVLPGAAPMPGGVPVQGATQMQAPSPMPGGVSMPPSAARLAQPMPPTAPSAVAPMAGAALPAPAADLASLNLTQQEATYLAQLPPSEQRAAYSQIQQKKLTEKPDFVERPMTPAEIASFGLKAGLPWTMGKDGPYLPGGREPAPTNINLPKGPGAADSRLGAVYIDSLTNALDAGDAARSGLQTNEQIVQMLDQGAFTGPGANIKTTGVLIANMLGLAPEDELRKAENSQLLLTKFAGRSLEAAKSNQGQGALSNDERKLLERAAGGSLEMTEETMRRVAELSNKVYSKMVERASLAGDILSSDDPFDRKPEWFKRGGRVGKSDSTTGPATTNQPPVPGAQLAPDGQYYVKGENGQYYRVEGAQ